MIRQESSHTSLISTDSHHSRLDPGTGNGPYGKATLPHEQFSTVKRAYPCDISGDEATSAKSKGGRLPIETE